MTKPKHSSWIYPSVIVAFGLDIFLFLTYYFNIFMCLSMGYIHLMAIGPQKSNSSTKWYIKWVMMSKKNQWKMHFQQA
jgi:hypothetical protein